RSLSFGETTVAKALFVLCIRNWHFASDEGGIRTPLLRALSEPWDRPAEVASAAASVVKLNPVIRASSLWPGNARPEPISAEDLLQTLAAIADDQLLRSLLETVPNFDIELERFLTKIRSALLDLAEASAGAPVDDRLLSACCA